MYFLQRRQHQSRRARAQRRPRSETHVGDGRSVNEQADDGHGKRHFAHEQAHHLAHKTVANADFKLVQRLQLLLLHALRHLLVLSTPQWGVSARGLPHLRTAFARSSSRAPRRAGP